MPDHEGLGKPAVDSLRISLDEWHTILSKMEDQNKSETNPERRQQERHSYRNILGVIIEMPDSEGVLSNYLVKSRNLSQGGLSFLHGEGLPTGNPCVVTLVKSNLAQDRCHGKIAHCRAVEEKIHEIGIEFDQPIDLTSYLSPANQVITMR